jgi:hypothetical protein
MRGSDCVVRPILYRNWLFAVRTKASRSPSDRGSLEPDRHPRPEGRRCRVYSAGITHRHEAIVHEPRPASISPPPSRSFATLSAMPPSQPTSWDQLSRAACVPTATSTSSSSAPIVDRGEGTGIIQRLLPIFAHDAMGGPRRSIELTLVARPYRFSTVRAPSLAPLPRGTSLYQRPRHPPWKRRPPQWRCPPWKCRPPPNENAIVGPYP